MRQAEIIEGNEYLAYVGSLARIRAIEKGLPYTYATGGKTQGVLVETLTDVPVAIDYNLAKVEGREQRLAHRQGERFVIPTSRIERAA